MMTFPIAVLVGGALHRVFHYAQDFTGPDDVQHPTAAWACWSEADWAEMCPGWTLVAFVDHRPADTLTHRYVQRPEADWDMSADALTVTYQAVALSAPEMEQARAALRRRYGDAIQRHLDATAQARAYDSIHTAVSYDGDPNPTWAAEGAAAKAWRSAVWTAAFAIMAAVEAGARPQPTEADLIAELPAVEWPE